MEQIARNVTDCETGFLRDKRFLLDRDVVFSPRFKGILESLGVEILRTAYQAPDMPSGVPVQRRGRIEVSERLGGLLKYYHRRAA